MQCCCMCPFEELTRPWNDQSQCGTFFCDTQQFYCGYLANFIQRNQTIRSQVELHPVHSIWAHTPLCKSNGTFFSGMDINELTSGFRKYKNPVTKCCILACCCGNLVCVRHVIVKIMPEKHAWGPDFFMSNSPYIFQLFENQLNCAAIQVDKFWKSYLINASNHFPKILSWKIVNIFLLIIFYYFLLAENDLLV